VASAGVALSGSFTRGFAAGSRIYRSCLEACFHQRTSDELASSGNSLASSLRTSRFTAFRTSGRLIRIRVTLADVALAQILEVIYEIEKHGYSRPKATRLVAERRGTVVPTIMDRYYRCILACSPKRSHSNRLVRSLFWRYGLVAGGRFQSSFISTIVQLSFCLPVFPQEQCLCWFFSARHFLSNSGYPLPENPYGNAILCFQCV
jgi:hypothetical protein